MRFHVLWGQGSFDSCLHRWYKNYFKYKELPLFISSYIWNFRNAIIFEERKSNSHWLCNKIFTYFKELWKERKQHSPFSIPLLRERESFPNGKFDGVSQANLCGAGMLIQKDSNNYFQLWMGSGT